MNCKKFEHRILNGEISEDITEHSKNCRECRILIESMELLQVDVVSNKLEIPSEIDKFILNEAEKRNKLYHHRKFINYLAYAAGFIIVAGIIASVIFSSDHNKKTCSDISSYTTTLCNDKQISENEISFNEIDQELSGIESELDILDTDISSIEDDYSSLLRSENK